jgi:hypothetical protein
MSRSLRSRKLRFNHHPRPPTQSPNYLDLFIQNPEPYALRSQRRAYLTTVNRRNGILHLTTSTDTSQNWENSERSWEETSDRKQPCRTERNTELCAMSEAKKEGSCTLNPTGADIKCVYDEPGLPCEFCLSRNLPEPCVKLRGPKTEEVPRPLPTAADDVIDPHDLALLRPLYTGRPDGFYMNPLWKAFWSTMPQAFGETIPSQTLRHAALIFASHRHYPSGPIPTAKPSKIFLHSYLACRSIRRRMENHELNQEADCVAIFLLAEMAVELNNFSEFQVHYLGLISMLENMLQRESLYRPQFLSEFAWFMLRLLSDSLRIIEPQSAGFLSTLDRYPSLRGLLRPQFRKFGRIPHFQYLDVTPFFQFLSPIMDLSKAEALGGASQIALGRDIVLSMLEDLHAVSTGQGFRNDR